MKVNKGSRPVSNGSINSAKLLAEQRSKENINFSFKYIDAENTKFCFYNHDGKYFIEFIDRIKVLSSWSKQEIISNRSGALKAHPIDFGHTSESGFNFPQHDQIVDVPYQFSLGKNEHGRVHGFFINNTFYIVWLDKMHELYP